MSDFAFRNGQIRSEHTDFEKARRNLQKNPPYSIIGSMVNPQQSALQDAVVSDDVFARNRMQNLVTNAVMKREHPMKDDMACDDHASTFMPKKHPDFGHKEKPGHYGMPEHKRGAGHPAKHSRGKMPSQLNPDHGRHD